MIMLRSPNVKIDSLVFSPDGSWLVSPLRGHGIFRWTISDGANPTLLPSPKDVKSISIQFTSDEKSMVIDGWSIFIRDIASEDEVEAKFSEAIFGRVALTQDGQSFIAALAYDVANFNYRLVLRRFSNINVDVWSVDTQRYFQGAALNLPGGKQFLTVEFETGTVGADLGTVFVTRNALTGQPVWETCYPGRGYAGLVSSPDFRYFAAMMKRSLTVFKTQATRVPVVVLTTGSRKEFTSAAFHPSGRYLATTCNDATVKVYDTTTWELAKTFTWTIGPLRSIAFSQDGLLAAVGGVGKVLVWDWDL